MKRQRVLLSFPYIYVLFLSEPQKLLTGKKFIQGLAEITPLFIAKPFDFILFF